MRQCRLGSGGALRLKEIPVFIRNRKALHFVAISSLVLLASCSKYEGKIYWTKENAHVVAERSGFSSMRECEEWAETRVREFTA